MATTPNDSPVNIDALVIYMKKKFDDSSFSNFRNHYIYRVNKKFRKTNPDAYVPEMVSIGPFHRKQGSLAAMEEHKLHCLVDLLRRKDKNLQACIEHMTVLLDNTRNSYAESIKLDNNEFVEMMLLDGSFIINLFLKYAGQDEVHRREDPYLNNLWSIASLKRDILLLENQLPMLVLDNLFNFTMNPVSDQVAEKSVTELSLRFFDGLIMPEPYNLDTYRALTGKHLLDLLGKSLHPSSPAQPSRTWKSVPSVTELTQAGVKFKRGCSSNRLLDIKFNNGVLEIPPIVIHDLTETLLRNLIAYEQCSHQKATYMISYAFFMDSLIDSEEDVRILCEEGIMKNNLGNDESVSDLFNTLCEEATLENFHYSDICDEVNAYYETRWHRWRATLNRDYFQNPWTIMSFVAAVFLLLLTIAQTVLSVFQLTGDTDLGTSTQKWLDAALRKITTEAVRNITNNNG